MSDPLSLAAAGAGFASLGIQLCQSLVAYVGAIQSRDEEIASALAQVRALEAGFETLRSVFRDFESCPDLYASAVNIERLRVCLDDGALEVDELRKLLHRLDGGLGGRASTTAASSPGTASGVKHHLKKVGSKLTYPFRQADLRAMQQRVNVLANTVQLVVTATAVKLDAVQLHTVLDLRLMAEKQATVSNGLVANTSDIVVALDTLQVESQTQIKQAELTDRTIGDLQSRVDAYQQSVTNAVLQYQQHQREAIDWLDNRHSEVMSRMVAIETEVRTLNTRMLEKPSLLKDTCQRFTESYKEMQKLETITIDRFTVTRRAVPDDPFACICPQLSLRTRRRKNSKLVLGSITLTTQLNERSYHQRSCPQYNAQYRRSFSCRLPHSIANALDRLTRVTTLSSKSIGGGCWLGMPLSCLVVVGDETFEHVRIQSLQQEVRKRLQDATNLADIEEGFRSTERGLNQLYHDGFVHPNHLDKFGFTQMERFIQHEIHGIPWRDIPYSSLDLLIDALYQQMSRLVAGEWNNGTNLDLVFSQVAYHYHMSRSSSYLPSPEFSTIFSKLSRIFDHSADWTTVYQLAGLWLVSPSFFDEIDFGNIYMTPLTRAVLSRSESDAERILRENPSAIHDTFLDWTTLHLSLPWADGLRLLLATGGKSFMNKPNCFRGVIITAVLCGLSDALQALLDAGASMWVSEWVPGHLVHCCVRCWRCINRSFFSALEPVLLVVVRCLAQRRSSLFEIAKKVLPEAHFSEIMRDATGLPDEPESARLTEALEARGWCVPTEISVANRSRGSIPESLYLDVVDRQCSLFLLEQLQRAGFRDMNRRINGLTTLMGSDIFEITRDLWENNKEFVAERLSWLQAQDCLGQTAEDPSGRGHNTFASGFHYVAMYFGLRVIPLGNHNQFESVILGSILQDNCVCWCGNGGCTPFHAFFRNRDCCWKINWRGFLQNRTHDESFQWSIDFIRILTFEMLEMTHTCCWCQKTKKFDGDLQTGVIMNFVGDRDEIRTEEQGLAERLDQLMEEFEHELRRIWATGDEMEEHDLVAEFLGGYWKERMRVECLPSCEEESILEKMGIKVARAQKDLFPRKVWIFLGDFDIDCSTTKNERERDEEDERDEGREKGRVPEYHRNLRRKDDMDVKCGLRAVSARSTSDLEASDDIHIYIDTTKRITRELLSCSPDVIARMDLTGRALDLK